MLFFDHAVISFLNKFSRTSPKLDSLVKLLIENNLFKSAFLIAFLWWAWSRTNNDQKETRIKLISTLCSCLLAIITGRFLAITLPYRFRPFVNHELDFILPYGMNPELFKGWSSFPSDHALLYYAFSFGILYVSKRAGYAALIYTTLLIALPRIYLGLHYPTDLICGAIIGILITICCHSSLFKNAISLPIYKWSLKEPQYFYPLLFLFSFELSTIFNNSRMFFHFILFLYR